MGKKSKNHFYAYRADDVEGIVDSWSECEALVSGRRARYRGFETRETAQAWLDGGAEYEKHAEKKALDQAELPESAIYFDAGTGRGRGTEVNVTDRAGVPLAHMEAPERVLTEFGTVLLSPGRTNNYGELMGCLYAMRVARRLGILLVMGDSKLVLDFWSKGRVGHERLDGDTDLKKLVDMTVRERRAFEAVGGRLEHVPGRINPADLGFHKE